MNDNEGLPWWYRNWLYTREIMLDNGDEELPVMMITVVCSK